MTSSKINNYPSGFDSGVLMRDLMNPETTTGQNFYVGNHTSLLTGEKSAADTTRIGSFLRPFATLDHAINQCKASNGDRIYLRPGHTETVTAATTIVMDTNGVQVIALGNGEERAVVTFTTAAAAAIPCSGANYVFANIIFKCNVTSQTHMMDLTGAAGTFIGCSFREGTQTGLAFITADGTDADIDRTRFINCDFYAPTAGNYNEAIELANDFTGVELIDCYIYGDFDVGCFSVPTGGNAQVNLQIRGGEYTNTQTGIGSIVIIGTASTGTIRDVLLKGDTESVALDAGGLAVDNVRWTDSTADQVSSTPIFPETDSASNILGADDANNVFASTSVADNRDGSIIERLEGIHAAQVDDIAGNLIGFDDANNVGATTSVVSNVDGTVLERLEALMDPTAVYDPVLGFQVLKTATLASSPDALFTVTGRCLITLVTGELTTNVATTTTMLLADSTNSINLCATTTITGDTVGTVYLLSGVKADVLNGGIAPVVGSASVANGSFTPLIIGDAQAAITIQHTLSGAGTGIVAWSLYYKPLISGATVVAAA